ncbi:MAG: HypC/HybG/HupF family hydrogenase formation chaperone [Candidatus Zixiibacteriota bacterium]|nr:MAG: HypC/HybG/HupF family hydrogenase formation chaperone [candidate division Zixibacteria bacterium]
MCLAVPMKLVEMNGPLGVVELGGLRREVGLDLLADVRVGDYLIVHAGYAIEKLDEAEALKTLQLFRDLAGEDEPQP